MDCEKAWEMMNMYLDGELNRQEQEELLNHLENCKDCKEEFEMLKNMVTDLRETEYLPLPEDYHSELIKKINETKVETVDFSKKKNNWKKYSSIAAALLILVVISTGGNVLLNVGHEKASGESRISNPVVQPMANGAMAMDSDKKEMATAPMAAPQDSPTADALTEQSIAEQGGMGINDATSGISPKVNANQINTEERKKIKTAQINLTVDSFEETVGNIRQTVEANGGYVENFNSYVFYEDISNRISLKAGNIKIRVEKESYDSTITYIKGLGNVINENEYVEDVTSQYVDTEARLNAKKTEELRLLKLLETAENVNDIVAIEGRLGEIRSEIESYQSQINNWDRLVGLSTINIEMKEKEPQGVSSLSPDFGRKIKDSFITSVNAVVNGFQSFVLGMVAFSIPSVIALAVIFIIYKIVRKIIKKIRK